MTCPDCEILLAQNDESSLVREHLSQCAECRELREDLRANALALESLRSEELPRVAIWALRRRRVYPWVAAAAAAAMFVFAFFTPRNVSPVRPAASQVVHEPAPAPLKIKMLTSDPNVVIYWLIEN